MELFWDDFELVESLKNEFEKKTIFRILEKKF